MLLQHALVLQVLLLLLLGCHPPEERDMTLGVARAGVVTERCDGCAGGHAAAEVVDTAKSVVAWQREEPGRVGEKDLSRSGRGRDGQEQEGRTKK